MSLFNIPAIAEAPLTADTICFIGNANNVILPSTSTFKETWFFSVSFDVITEVQAS